MSSEPVNPLTMLRYNKPELVAEKVIKKDACLEMAVELELPKPPSAPHKPDPEIQELLNAVLPPRTWEKEGKAWEQTVSSTPASREEVIRLQSVLDTRLALTQARASGLCHVRHGIYSECFDEIIRQATINCTERGLLLLRIRDEMKMTLDACEVLYKNAVEFGVRKALKASQEKGALTERVKDLEVSQLSIEKVIADMKQEIEQTELRTAEIYATEEAKFAEEIAFAKQANAQFKSQLEGIVQPRK